LTREIRGASAFPGRLLPVLLFRRHGNTAEAEDAYLFSFFPEITGKFSPIRTADSSNSVLGSTPELAGGASA
jgi:hypothetical protein